VALARDPQRRRHLADVIRQKMAATPRFLDPADYSAQIGALLERLVAQWPRPGE
jgi:predicted O-linked N-acetylglucosamine transferase (SPINDLY family)